MKSNRYTLTLTDETFAILNSLERKGYSVRNILNGGVVLFDEADSQERGRSVLVAFGKLEQELKFTQDRLEQVLEWINIRKGKDALPKELHQSSEQLLQALGTLHDLAAYPPGTKTEIIVVKQSVAEEFAEFRKLHGSDADEVIGGADKIQEEQKRNQGRPGLKGA